MIVFKDWGTLFKLEVFYGRCSFKDQSINFSLSTSFLFFVVSLLKISVVLKKFKTFIFEDKGHLFEDRGNFSRSRTPSYFCMVFSIGDFLLLRYFYKKSITKNQTPYQKSW